MTTKKTVDNLNSFTQKQETACFNYHQKNQRKHHYKALFFPPSSVDWCTAVSQNHIAKILLLTQHTVKTLHWAVIIYMRVRFWITAWQIRRESSGLPDPNQISQRHISQWAAHCFALNDSSMWLNSCARVFWRYGLDVKRSCYVLGFRRVPEHVMCDCVCLGQFLRNTTCLHVSITCSFPFHLLPLSVTNLL